MLHVVKLYFFLPTQEPASWTRQHADSDVPNGARIANHNLSPARHTSPPTPLSHVSFPTFGHGVTEDFPDSGSVHRRRPSDIYVTERRASSPQTSRQLPLSVLVLVAHVSTLSPACWLPRVSFLLGYPLDPACRIRTPFSLTSLLVTKTRSGALFMDPVTALRARHKPHGWYCQMWHASSLLLFTTWIHTDHHDCLGFRG